MQQRSRSKTAVQNNGNQLWYYSTSKRIIDQRTVPWFNNKYKEVVREKVVYDDPKDVFARIEALETQFAAKQQEFKEKYL